MEQPTQAVALAVSRAATACARAERPSGSRSTPSVRKAEPASRTTSAAAARSTEQDGFSVATPSTRPSLRAGRAPGERAQDAVRPTLPSSRAAASAAGPLRALDVDHAQPLLRRTPPSGRRPPSPPCRARRPLLTPARSRTNAKRTSSSVGPSAMAIGGRRRAGRLARAIRDRVDDNHQGMSPSPNVARRAPRDEPERDAAPGQLLQPCHRRRLGLAVDHGGVISSPWPTTARDRPGWEAAKLSSTSAATRGEAEPVLPHASCGSSRNPDHSRKK